MNPRRFSKIGADRIIPRGEPIGDFLAANSVDTVVDVVVGPQFGELLDTLKPGRRYVTTGPIVEFDVRTLYLKDLTLLGRSLQERTIFETWSDTSNARKLCRWFRKLIR